MEPRGMTLDARMFLVTLKGALFQGFCLVRSQRASTTNKRIAIDAQALLEAPRVPLKKIRSNDCYRFDFQESGVVVEPEKVC